MAMVRLHVCIRSFICLCLYTPLHVKAHDYYWRNDAHYIGRFLVSST